MIEVAIVGAGPNGLSLSAHLKAVGVPYRIFGKALSLWREHMPSGMYLKSDGFASSLSDPQDATRLDTWCTANGQEYHDTHIPVPLQRFVEYALDFQRQHVPQLESAVVTQIARDDPGFRLTLDTGETVLARKVVMATGLIGFENLPDAVAGLPPTLASHSSAHTDFSCFAGKDVAILGAGASAADIAAALLRAGSSPIIIARAGKVRFHTPPTFAKLSLWRRLRRPPSGIGPGWRSRLCNDFPGVYRCLPDRLRLQIVRRLLGPAPGWQVYSEIHGKVPLLLRHKLVDARADGKGIRLDCDTPKGRAIIRADHVIAATGYLPAIDRLPVLDDTLRQSIRLLGAMPRLDSKFQSSVRGLYFVGPLAANSFGPLMRFMVGAEYTAPKLARALANG